MARQQPPVPPANRSPKGTGSDPGSTGREKPQRNPGGAGAKPEGEQQNIDQNTHHQGYQQDR